jgi:hypothetical protein
MRTVARDREDVYIAQRLPSVPEIDENGYETGTMLPQFDVSVKYRLRVQPISEDADIQLYGAQSVSMRKIIESPLSIGVSDISYLDPVWIGTIPSTYGDALPSSPVEGEPSVIPLPLDNNYYVSVQPIQTPRQIVIMLKSVIENG